MVDIERAEEAVRSLLLALGEDPDREGLAQTPTRVANAWRERLRGYELDPDEILSRTFSEAEGYDEVIMVRRIPVRSVCEHHLLPVTGIAWVGYVPRPDGPVVGLSKLARLVEVFAARLQLQERLTRQVAEAIERRLEPLGVGVIVRAEHGCMSCRGVLTPDSDAITSAMLGCFRDKPEARAEFLRLVEIQ